MSRNQEYQFVPTDPAEIASRLIAKFEELTGETVRPASPEMLFISWVEDIIIHERVLTNYAGNQNIPSRAEGKNLDALAELFRLQSRPGAQAAECVVRFYISEPQESAVLIPVGTRVSDRNKTLFWETREDAYVDIGAEYADVRVYCQTPGLAGNGWEVGQLNMLVDVYDYYARCTNITASDGGADKADDNAFYELIRASMDGYSCAGAQGGYIYWAKQVSTEIADVIANSPTPGVVKLYVLMRDGSIAGEEIKRQVMAACNADEIRPLTDLVSVEDPETVTYDVAFTYYTQSGTSKSAAVIRAEVNAAVERYNQWQCGKLGRDINPSKLIDMLMDTGIKRVALTAPEFTALHSGGVLTVPQTAVLGCVSITNGGYEDE